MYCQVSEPNMKIPDLGTYCAAAAEADNNVLQATHS